MGTGEIEAHVSCELIDGVACKGLGDSSEGPVVVFQSDLVPHTMAKERRSTERDVGCSDTDDADVKRRDDGKVKVRLTVTQVKVPFVPERVGARKR